MWASTHAPVASTNTANGNCDPNPSETDIAIPSTINKPDEAGTVMRSRTPQTIQIPSSPSIRVSIYSAVAAHFLPGKPVWLFVVSVGGGGKTESLMPLRAVNVHFLSHLTPHTFISGFTWRNRDENDPERDGSLLSRIKNGIIVCKDFTQVLSMPMRERGPVLADLRDIYDGYIEKAFGTGECKRWSGRITFLAAVTQDLDRHYSIFQSMGERFVQVRWPRPGGEEAALKAMSQERSAEQEITEAVANTFEPILKSKGQLANPIIPVQTMRRLASLTEFALRARTHVPRDGYTREISYMPEPEAATRMAQELAQLARGSAILIGRNETNEEDFQIALRVGMDSIPANRRRALKYLIEEERCWTNGELEKATGLPPTMISRLIGDLIGLGIVAEQERQDFGNNAIALSSEARRLLDQMHVKGSVSEKCIPSV